MININIRIFQQGADTRVEIRSHNAAPVTQNEAQMARRVKQELEVAMGCIMGTIKKIGAIMVGARLSSIQAGNGAPQLIITQFRDGVADPNAERVATALETSVAGAVRQLVALNQSQIMTGKEIKG